MVQKSGAEAGMSVWRVLSMGCAETKRARRAYRFSMRPFSARISRRISSSSGDRTEGKPLGL